MAEMIKSQFLPNKFISRDRGIAMYDITILIRIVATCYLLQACTAPYSREEPVLYSLKTPIQVPVMWEYTTPLITTEKRTANRSRAQKDPSVVFYEGMWHVFMTIKTDSGTRVEYVSFKNWKNADKAPRHVLMLADSEYFAATQIFYFEPQKKWYLIYQLWVPGKKNMQISFSTTTDISDPDSWTKAASVFRRDEDDPRQQGGLDYWVICDQQRAYLFFTSLDGKLWRMWTRLENFPYGFGHLEIALQADIYEASHTYKIKGMDKYLTIVEANPDGNRYYKLYLADELGGTWTPLADTRETPFAGDANVRPAAGVAAWTDNISHGELIRTGYDQTMEIDPEKLQLVFQGMLQKDKASISYGQIPWRIGILIPAGQSAPK